MPFATKQPPLSLSEMTLEEVVLKLVKTKTQGFRALDRSEAILCELISRMKVGDQITVGVGKKPRTYELVDNFRDKNTAYRAKQFSRLELMDVTPKPKKVGARKAAG
jgi:hypothetical protein